MHPKLEFDSPAIIISPGIGEVSKQNLMISVFLQIKLQYSSTTMRIKV